MAKGNEPEGSKQKGGTQPAPDHRRALVFAPGDFMDRTFLGGIKLSSRISLFVLVGLCCLAFGAFGLFRAQEDMAAARNQLAKSYELAKLVDTVELTVWRIRAEGILLKQDGTRTAAETAKATEAHITRAMELGRKLDDMYQRFDTAGVGDYISTIREAIAQYAETYSSAATDAGSTGAIDTVNPARNLQAAARNLQDRLAKVNILSLTKTFNDMRKAEAAFIKNGQAGSLIIIKNQQDAFLRLLSMVPLNKTDAAELEKRMQSYQQRLTKYAKGRLTKPKNTRRRDEIFSYMTPSIEGLRAYADQQLASGMQNERRLRDFYLPLIASVGAGLLLIVLFAGALILHSITGPVIAAAEASRRIIEGETDAVVWGLGNDDETGDVARSVSILKVKLGDIVSIRESLKKAKTEAERGRAATEEAAWLRHDLESMKAEVDKGQAAIEEVELLHKVIEATRNDSIESAATGQENDAREKQQSERRQPRTPIDQDTETANLNTISQISQQVAQSSQSVTAAAGEAERTGTLIRNLNDAFKRVASIETLVKTIGEQADLLWVGEPSGKHEDTASGSNLVMFTPDPRGNGDPIPGPRLDRPEMESSIGRRFDIIRATASQTTWALRDINDVILRARNLALTIAQTTSAEALHVTTDLLEQSENLRYMLDSLVHKMRDQLFDDLIEDTSETSKERSGDRDDKDVS